MMIGNTYHRLMGLYYRQFANAKLPVFAFGAKGMTHQEAFQKGLEETQVYKAGPGQGNANTPSDYVSPSKFKLGNWQDTQRTLQKKKGYPPKRRKALNALGFSWDLHEAAFQRGLEETQAYKEGPGQGNANAPTIYVSPSGFNLGQWQRDQRASQQKRKYPQRKYPLKRKKALKALGFSWSLPKRRPSKKGQ